MVCAIQILQNEIHNNLEDKVNYFKTGHFSEHLYGWCIILSFIELFICKLPFERTAPKIDSKRTPLRAFRTTVLAFGSPTG